MSAAQVEIEMENQTVFDLGDVPAEPFRGECPACSEDVLSVVVDGREVALDPHELYPEGPCLRCTVDQRTGKPLMPVAWERCWACHNTRVTGAPVPAGAIAVAAGGHARVLDHAGAVSGEGAYLPHACGVAQAA